MNAMRGVWAVLLAALGIVLLLVCCAPQIPLPPPDEEPHALEGDAGVPHRPPPSDAGPGDIQLPAQTDATGGNIAPLEPGEAIEHPGGGEPPAVDPTGITHP